MVDQYVPDRYSKEFMLELLARVKRVESDQQGKLKDVVVGLPDALAARGVAKPRLILISPDGTRYEIRVDNLGTLLIDGPIPL